MLYMQKMSRIFSIRKRHTHDSLLLLLAAQLILIPACNPDRKVDSASVRDEIASREPKKVTESDILAHAAVVGGDIASQARTVISGNLMAALIEGGLEYAIGFCNLKASPIVDSLRKNYGAEIRRVTFKARNPADRPDEIEAKILEAYTEAIANGQAMADHVQILDDSQVLFARPITIDNALCLSCHGTPGQELSADAQALIRKYYPDDEAVGYQIGELRGMWSIRLQKKNLVAAL